MLIPAASVKLTGSQKKNGKYIPGTYGEFRQLF